ncbi:hypothetical protein Y1Q_0002538 [Alligator mississippiensis]|uniref:Uncharacterized protein n=1 Tax=Alligator mississippiensis TaxID=8496 RepID=A0A151NBA9_ALLMI|nr:hypothetical protein Y1Q_0002538 [Alligator mississippiensis]
MHTPTSALSVNYEWFNIRQSSLYLEDSVGVMEGDESGISYGDQKALLLLHRCLIHSPKGTATLTSKQVPVERGASAFDSRKRKENLC